MIGRLTPITGFGLVARERDTALVVLAADERADGIIEAWRRCTTAPSPLEDFSRHLDTLPGPPPPLAMVSIDDRSVRFVACGGMELAWHGPIGPGSLINWHTITAPGAPERHTLDGEVWTLKVAAMGASTQVDPRTHLESGVVHAAGFNLGVSAGTRAGSGGDRRETAPHDAIVVDAGPSAVTGPSPVVGASAVTGTAAVIGTSGRSDRRDPSVEPPVGSSVGSVRGSARRDLFAPVAGGGLTPVSVDAVVVDPVPVDLSEVGRPRDALFSPPPPAIVPVDAPPPSGPSSGTSGRILLIDAPAPALPPLPLADDPGSEVTGTVDAAPADMVLGIRCTRDHLNDPDAYYCAQCGIAMVHLTHKLSEGRRPSLGFLVFDDGTAFTVDSEYVIGRAPHDDARVDEGTLRPLTIDDRTRTVSRVHADIKLEGWHVYLVDRNSTNGSYLWDEQSGTWVRLPPGTATRLTPGAHAAIGQRVFHFESPHEQRV